MVRLSGENPGVRARRVKFQLFTVLTSKRPAASVVAENRLDRAPMSVTLTPSRGFPAPSTTCPNAVTPGFTTSFTNGAACPGAAVCARTSSPSE